MEKIFLFAGQGSQFFGMGKFLYEDNVCFRKQVDHLDEKIIALYGKSVKTKMMDESRRLEETFNDIIESSFAIFMFEYSAARMMIDAGIKPDAVIGCSLGELAAQTVAGALTVDEALNLLLAQSQLFKTVLKTASCMLVVGANYKTDIDSKDYERCEVISVSHDRQCVVSGLSEDLENFEQKLNEKHLPFIRLPVHYPFHTAQMETVKESFLQMLKKLNLGERTCSCKMYSCVTGRKVEKVDDRYRWEVLRKKIQWHNCIIQFDIDRTIMIDLSPDGELATSLKYLTPANKDVYKVSTMFHMKVDIADTVRKVKDKGGSSLKAFIFPGQGSQIKGMGADVFDEFGELVEIADRVLGYSIKELCLQDPEGVLSNTKYTQPALYTVCTLGYLKKVKEEGEPDFVLGHSIGEYAALFAGGVIDFETGLRLVKKRAELMARANGGTMAAVVGLNKDQVERVLRENGLDRIDVANLNTPTQIVISGLKEDIVGAEEYFKNAKGCFMYKVLNVSGAFHSRYMQPAKEEFTEYLKQFEFHKMKIPVIANITARPYREADVVDYLSKQLVSSVQWTDSIRYAMAKGVEKFEEIGPGHVASGMVRKIKREAQPLDLSKEPKEIEKVEIPIAVPLNTQFITGRTLGNAQVKEDYKLKYAYFVGSMGKGISGVDMLEAAANTGILAFAGTTDLSDIEIETMIREVQGRVKEGQSYGFNLTYDIADTARERRICDLYLRYGVTILEASAYSTITKPLVKYRLTGLRKDSQGNIIAKNNIIAKVSRSEIAECFMSPAPQRIVDVLVKEGEITEQEAKLAQYVPMSNDICVQADSGGYTDCANMFSVFPAIQSICKHVNEEYQYAKKVRVGVSGGIGTAQSAAAAFMMGADFIMTGSVNQCTAEAVTSETAKEMMSAIHVQDTGYIQAWDEYGLDGKIQIMKRGTLFKVRADKLYRIYQEVSSLDEIDEKTRTQIEERYFKMTFGDVMKELKRTSNQIEEATGKQKVKLIFQWYDVQSKVWAMEGNPEHLSDYQIMCGPALGAFNEWVKGTELENWKNRTIRNVAEKIMESAAEYQQTYIQNLYTNN